jgi:hypothetical protein
MKFLDFPDDYYLRLPRKILYGGGFVMAYVIVDFGRALFNTYMDLFQDADFPSGFMLNILWYVVLAALLRGTAWGRIATIIFCILRAIFAVAMRLGRGNLSDFAYAQHPSFIWFEATALILTLPAAYLLMHGSSNDFYFKQRAQQSRV